MKRCSFDEILFSGAPEWFGERKPGGNGISVREFVQAAGAGERASRRNGSDSKTNCEVMRASRDRREPKELWDQRACGTPPARIPK